MRLAIVGLATTVLFGLLSGLPGGGQTVTEQYGVNSITWKTGARIYVFVGAHEINGKLAICGAYAVGGDTALTARFKAEALAGASAEIDGERIVQGLGHLNELPFFGTTFGDYVGQPTTCRQTDTPWRPEYREAVPQMSFPQTRFIA